MTYLHMVVEWVAGILTMAGIVVMSVRTVSQDPPYAKPFGLIDGRWNRPDRRLIVKTESNVKREKMKLPDPPCVICKGTGRVKCNRCWGRGRTNFKDLAMLPKGEWPKWCWDCRGCGKSYCTRCFGTGEKRGIIGFHLPDDEPGNHENGTQN